MTRQAVMARPECLAFAGIAKTDPARHAPSLAFDGHLELALVQMHDLLVNMRMLGQDRAGIDLP